MFLAKALLDNVAERPEELAFRRGDVVTVITQDAGRHSSGGWWLCSFRGRQGIVPANRLKILSGLMTEETEEEEEEKEEEEEERADFSVSLRQEQIQNNTSQCQQSSEYQQDYDVPPSRHPLSPTQSSTPTGSSLYDIPSNLSAPGRDTPTLHTYRLLLNPSKSFNSPLQSKLSSMAKRSPWKSCTSVDRLASVSFQEPSVSGNQREKLLCKASSNRKRWSAESGSLMLSYRGDARMPREDIRRLRLSRDIETIKSSECISHQLPRVRQRDFVRKMLPEDQSMHCIPSQDQPEEKIYDVPNLLSRGLSHAGAERKMAGKRLHVSTSESSISDISPHPVSSQYSISSAASLSGTAVCSTDTSLPQISGLLPSQSCSSHQLFLNTRSENRHHVSTLYPAFPVNADIPRPLSDSFTEDRFHDNKKTSQNEENKWKTYRQYTSMVNMELEKSDCVSPSAVSCPPCPVYDTPPRVNRHSMTSASSVCSGDSFRLSSCSMDSTSSGAEYYCLSEDMYEELQIDQDSAAKLLTNLQDNVSKSALRVIMSVSSSECSVKSPQSNLCDVKAACMELKKAVTQLVEFAQGTLANLSDVSDKKLVSQFVKQVHHLHRHLKMISETLVSLEDTKVQVSQLVEPVNLDHQGHLDRITSLTKDLAPEVTKLISLIHASNSSHFKRSSDDTTLSGDLHAAHDKSLPSLPQSGTATPQSAPLQLRPLPPLPLSLSEKLSAPVSAGQTYPSRQLTSSQNNLNDSVEVIQRSMQQCHVDDHHNGNDGDHGDDVQEDYDYVQLEACESEVQKKNWQQKQSKHDQLSVKNTDKEPDVSNPSMTDTNQNLVVMEKKTRKEKYARIVTQAIHHAGKVFAQLGPKHSHAEKVSAKKEITRSSTACNSHPDNPSQPEVRFQELGANTCDKPGSKPPVQSPLPNGLYITNRTLQCCDQQVLCYYSKQLETHCALLAKAVDTFMVCIENKEPPRVFISKTKFVIVTAYKLIYMGDALFLRLVNRALRDQVLRCANQVCESLKVCVKATKTAALQFPSVTAVQHMVDRVVDVLHAAHEFRLLIGQAGHP